MASKDSSEQHRGGVEAGLITACKGGDRAAQRRLYELCHGKIYALMVRMAGPEQAADLTQDVFLRAFQKIEQFAGDSKFETWLYRLAVNEALGFHRKRGRRSHESLVNEPAAPARSHQQTESREMLEIALARLDPELRAVFVLKEIEELSYRDIAAATGIAKGTVGSRLNRARSELRRLLIELGWRE